MAKPTLRKGMSGKKGTEVGEAIREWRVFIGLVPATSVTVYDFGAGTEKATMIWQGANGLRDPKRSDGLGDGIVGPMTWGKYQSLQFGPPVPPVAKEAAKVIAAQAPTAPVTPVAATTAAKTIAAKKPAAKKPVAVKPPVTVTPTAAIIAKIPTSVQEVKAQTKQAVAVIQAAPLWGKIVGGTVSTLLAWSVMKKIFR